MAVNMCSTDRNSSLSLPGRHRERSHALEEDAETKAKSSKTLKLPASYLHDAEHAGGDHARSVHCYSALQVCDALLAVADVCVLGI
jgi:hypothetical protein